MSGHHEHPARVVADGHGHHDDHGGADHGTLKSYTTGFLLAVILTAIPFWIVLGKVFEKSSTTALVVLALAAVQVVVHMIYFLHMNTKSEGGWSMLALIFTIMLVVIMLSGSLWVMYHLNHNMMPGMTPDQMQEATPESIQQMQNRHEIRETPQMPKMHDMNSMHKMP
ncbi:cytochrome o ubiquinol oxidase subunit IV [Glaciimonas sp. PCH181]|uniref:cytochrome o ubiquinol oxidase subunit IV n=1 Tax=Glaciimonas sp. PCH181 TaxID=2133943 RepID=UPI000D3C6EF7|nr:cytochrome o ubiquinol oxidase subunit IV [Glaciimonas sp. PCH181]PUA17542.1 cytochrome o ubiquinol oxidase subunit IV [Glaciimonas sp. PCH181]